MAFWIPRRKPRMVQASTATSVPVSTVYSWPVLVKVLFWPFTATRKLDLENADAMGFSTEKSRDPLSTQLRASFQPPCVECHVLGRESVANPTRWFLRNHPILDPTRWGKKPLLFTERWWFWMAFLHRLKLVGIYQFTCWYLWLSHLGSSLASLRWVFGVFGWVFREMEAHSEATSDLPRVLQGSRTTLGTQHPNFFMVYSELSPLDEDTGEGDSTDSLIVTVKTLVGLYEFRPFNSATCTEVPSYASDLRSGMFRHQHLAAADASWHEISFEKGMCLKKVCFSSNLSLPEGEASTKAIIITFTTKML